MRKRIFEIIEVAAAGDRMSRVYDLTMIGVILLGLIPLAVAVLLAGSRRRRRSMVM